MSALHPVRVSFEAVGVAPLTLAVAPSLAIRIRVRCDETSAVHAIVLQARLRLVPTSRSYTECERARLVPLFGEAKQWAQTTRSPLTWAEASIATGRFEGTTEIELVVPCTYDLALATAKLFDALDGGTLAVSILFSGTIFCDDLAGGLVVQPVPSQDDVRVVLPIDIWRAVMEAHHPDGALVRLSRPLADRIRALGGSMASLERTLATLVDEVEQQRSRP